ncbi:MAG TPA: acetyltransferase [Ignavibacteria bacterium]|nr:acetyltransferase [Ignavibacteria bacterium]
MKEIIIFGTGKIADVIQYFMREISNLSVKAFTVDKEFISDEEFNGLPVIDFSNIENSYPPDKYSVFVALGYHDLNRLRAKKIEECEKKGYEIISYIHPDSGIPSDLQYGKNCFIMDNVCIHPRVKLGNNVFVWSGTIIGHHSEIGNNCWLTSGCNISGVVKVGDNSFFAINSTVGHSVTLEGNNFLGANSLVTKNAKSGQVFIAESTKPFRLDSNQFLKFSTFSNL